MVRKLTLSTVAILVESIRSASCIPLILSLSVAIAIVSSIDLSIEVGKGLLTQRIATPGTTNVVTLSGSDTIMCFATLCNGTDCYDNAIIVISKNIDSPCIGKALKRALGWKQYIVAVDMHRIEISRTCRSNLYDPYIAIPSRLLPGISTSRCFAVGIDKRDVIAAISNYFVKELSENLVLAKVLILVSYALIVPPIAKRFIDRIQIVFESLKYCGIAKRELTASTILFSILLATLSTILGIAFATMAIHVATTLIKCFGILIATRPLPSTAAIGLYLAYSTAIACFSIVMEVKKRV